MQLYDLARSGNCYKVRLLLSILGVDYEKIPVDANAGDLQTAEFLAINPNGLVPVLIDGDKTIYDSAAILIYLALTHGGEDWISSAPLELGSIVRWLTFEQAEGRYGLARARAIKLQLRTPLVASGSYEESKIADIACYPYTALITDAGIALEAYTAIGRWLQAIENLPGYIALPRVS